MFGGDGARGVFLGMVGGFYHSGTAFSWGWSTGPQVLSESCFKNRMVKNGQNFRAEMGRQIAHFQTHPNDIYIYIYMYIVFA